MTVQDIGLVMDVLRPAYPAHFNRLTDDELYEMSVLWASMFEGNEPVLLVAAVKAFIADDEKGFPPAIGQIKRKMHDIANPNQLTEQEAWAMVSKATTMSASDQVKAFEAFPPEVKRVAGSPRQLREWGMMPTDVFQSVVASNVMRSFRSTAEQVRKFNALPEDVKRLSEKLAGKLGMSELPTGEIAQDKKQDAINTFIQTVEIGG